MTEEHRRWDLLGPILAGVLLLSLAAFAAGVFLKTDCPNCEGKREVPCDIDDAWIRKHNVSPQSKVVLHLHVECTRCSATGKVPLMRAWMERAPL